MQLSAKFIQTLPLQTGTGRNGEWKKQDIIVETQENFPKKICISIWGDRIQSHQLITGSVLIIDFDIESREYNGKWYTDVKAWKIQVAGGDFPAKNDDLAEAQKSTVVPDEEDDDDGLPF